MKKLVNDLKGLLSDPKELNKKQVALFLPQNKIDALDKIVKDLTSHSTRRINRNDLIEMAVNNLIECADVALKEYLNEFKKEDEYFDTIICPSKLEGVYTFLNEKKWYYVRIDKEKRKKIKWCGLYVGYPESEVALYAKVKEIKEDNQGKCIIYFDGEPKELTHKIPLGSTNPMGTRSCKYTTYDKLMTAKEYSDLN